MKNNIELKDVSKVYPDFSLEHVSFQVPEGAIVGLIGENGAGKTTTLKAILNIIETSGEISVLGKNVKQQGSRLKENIGVVLDDSFLSEYLNASGVAKILKTFYKNFQEEQYYAYLKQFHLPKNQLIKEFSSGMKMKLKIASVLAQHPQVLLLDEATSGLDPIARNEILELFRNFILEDEHRSILISSHITSDLEHIADYIVFIHEGKVMFQLPTEELLENYGIIKCREEEFQKLKNEDFVAYKKEKYQYEILVKDREKLVRKYKNIAIDKPTIEEIMLFYVKGEQK